jgi:hypothetical protein
MRVMAADLNDVAAAAIADQVRDFGGTATATWPRAPNGRRLVMKPIAPAWVGRPR